MKDRDEFAPGLGALRQREWIVVLSLCLALATAYGVTVLMPQRYEATTTLFVGPKTATKDVAVGVQYASLSQSLVTSYAKLAHTKPVIQDAATRAGVTPDEVRDHVKTETEQGVQVLSLTGSGSSGLLAARIANGMADALIARVASLAGRGAQVDVKRVDIASPPEDPVSPRLGLNLLLGGLAGLLAGILLALWRERSDRRVRTAREAEEEIGLPVLGTVPKLSWRARHVDALERHHDPKVAEPYRTLAVTLDRLAEQRGYQEILVTSAGNGDSADGSVAAHLALALSDENRRTALIEGDLRHASLRDEFPSEQSPGVEKVAAAANGGGLPESTSVRPNLKVVTPTEREQDGGRLLRTPQFQRTLEAAANESDEVIVDAPPALGVSDTAVLARDADAVVLVLSAGETRVEDARESLAVFERLGVDVAGAVLREGGRLEV